MHPGPTWKCSLCNKPKLTVIFHSNATTRRTNTGFTKHAQPSDAIETAATSGNQQPTAQPNNHTRWRPKQQPNKIQTTNKKTIKILQLNINGLTKKIN